MTRSQQKEASYKRLFLTEEQSDDHERSETIDIIKVNP